MAGDGEWTPGRRWRRVGNGRRTRLRQDQSGRVPGAHGVIGRLVLREGQKTSRAEPYQTNIQRTIMFATANQPVVQRVRQRQSAADVLAAENTEEKLLSQNGQLE